MANHTYSKGLLYKKTLNSSGEVTGSVPLLLKTLGSLVIMSDGTDAETAISTAISNMVTPDETTIVTGQDGITISVKKSTSAEIDEILGDVPTEHTWEGYYTKSEVNGLVNAVDAKFNQNDIETALGYTPIASSTKGSANGVASLDANGLVPSAQLPSYVDDVIESATLAALPATGETGKIYVTLNDNKTYRWSGSAYVEISQSLALGETSSTAFAGDKGKTAYEHASDTTKHVPTGGTNAQYLKNTGNNTYAWASPDSSWPATPTNNTIPGNKLVDDRFKVNESNILYAIQNGVKNWFDVAAEGNSQYGLSTYSADTETGTVNVASTTSSGSWARYRVPVTLPAGTYTISGNVTNIVGYLDITGNTNVDDQGTAIISRITRGSTGNFSSEFTINSETSFYVAFYANYSGTAQNRSATVTHMMISPKSVYDQDSSYCPPALPNYDLTRLEAEDRAALAEEIDAGAKNKVDIANVTITGSSFVLDHVAISLSAGSYVFSYTSNQSISGDIQLIVRNGTTALADVTVTSQSGRIEIPFTLASAANNITLYSVRAGTYSDFMVATKAAFGVSSKFVPYRPSYDLVCQNIKDVNTVLEAVL